MGGDTLNPNQVIQRPQMGGDTSNPKMPILMSQQKFPCHNEGRHFKPPHLESEKPTDMEIDDEGKDYMDEDPTIPMLREKGTYWEPSTIVEATTKLKNWAWNGAAHPMEDSVRKIKTIKSVTFAKKIEIGEPVTLAKNIVSVPIKFIFASVSIPVKSICDSFLVKSVEFVEFVKNFFPFNMIFILLICWL